MSPYSLSALAGFLSALAFFSAAGITSLTQIAAWTDADLAKYDEELALHGRATRDEWVQQAKDLVAGKPPRAKVDQEHAADKAKK